MKNFVKFSLLAIVAASATVASAADLEFHGYARGGLGFNTAGGNQIAFMQGVSGKSKFRLGNEADWCLEPGFTMSFTKLDDKSAWGVHMLPATYRRFNNGGVKTVGTGLPDDPATPNVDESKTTVDTDANDNADGGLNVSFKEFYFYGQNVPQLGGGEIWVGRRYFGRNYLGAINDSFLEAQDGIGAGVYDIPAGPAKVSFDIATPNVLNDGQDQHVIDSNLSIGGRVTNIPTFNKDSNLQIWARVYLPMQKTSGNSPKVNDPITPGSVAAQPAGKRVAGFSASAMHVAGFGAAGNLTVAARFDQNAYTDQQDNGSGGSRHIEANLVYGVNVASARTSVDALLTWRQSKSVKQFSGGVSPGDDTNNLYLAGFRTDTQVSGPFRFLLEVGYDTNKTKGGKQHNLLKITPCVAISGGNDPWSRPTFRLFYTYASWNKDGAGDVLGAWKDSGASAAFAGKTSGGSFGLQAEGWW